MQSGLLFRPQPTTSEDGAKHLTGWQTRHCTHREEIYMPDSIKGPVDPNLIMRPPEDEPEDPS